MYFFFRNVFLYIFCYDIAFYFTHLLLHTKLLYKYHRLHHDTPYDELTYYDTIKGHLIETILQNIGFILPPLIYIKYNFNELLLSISFVCIRGAMRHDHKFTYLIGNHHLLHHKNQRYNFGELWIDYLMGTVYPYKSHRINGYIYN
jgi:sterol desaturase/sphingolipid hydroxylase (fatty acid hydroxylase superfamily)